MKTTLAPFPLTLFIIALVGCATDDPSIGRMRVNRDVLSLPNAELAVGRVFLATNSIVVADRVRHLCWPPDVNVATLFRQWARPTHLPLAVTFNNHSNLNTSSVRISDLNQTDQDLLRQLWKERILATLQDSTFQCDLGATSAAIDSGGLIVYYFLVNRHNSAEMGHVDVVKFLITDRDGRIVARTKPQYSLDYPLCFVNAAAWTYDFLL